MIFKDATNDDNLDACLSKISKTLGQCILDCNDDTDCEASCVSTFKEEHSECPCQVVQNVQWSEPYRKLLGELSTWMSM